MNKYFLYVLPLFFMFLCAVSIEAQSVRFMRTAFFYANKAKISLGEWFTKELKQYANIKTVGEITVSSVVKSIDEPFSLLRASTGVKWGIIIGILCSPLFKLRKEPMSLQDRLKKVKKKTLNQGKLLFKRTRAFVFQLYAYNPDTQLDRHYTIFV